MATLKSSKATKAAERSLVEYVRQAWDVLEPATDYIHGWHVEVICEHLEAVTRGEIKNLIINVPPGCMKSLLVSVMWPTWDWIAHPHRRYLTASYAQTLSTRDALKSRRLLQSQWYQERWGDRFALTSDQNQKTRYDNDRSGFRVALSVGGAVTGERGDVRICLPYDQTIVTRHSCLPIGQIVEQGLDVEVLTYNHDTECLEWQPISRHERNAGRRLVEVDLGDQVIHCTEDHPVYVEGKGYTRAVDLQEGDVVLYCANPVVK